MFTEGNLLQARGGAYNLTHRNPEGPVIPEPPRPAVSAGRGQPRHTGVHGAQFPLHTNAYELVQLPFVKCLPRTTLQGSPLILSSELLGL